MANITDFNVEINLDNLTIADFPKLQNIGKPDADMNELVDMLDRAVVGGARQLPLSLLVPLVKALGDQLSAAMNPEAQGKN